MKSMFSWLPMTLFLAVIWILLADVPLGLGTVVFGLIAALIIVLMSRRLRPFLAKPRKIGVILKLVARVLKDTFDSNVMTLRIIMRQSRTPTEAGFITVPLTLRDPHGLAVLASIINYAPGTLWAGFPESGDFVELHILDMHAEPDWAAYVIDRYETPLREIFE